MKDKLYTVFVVVVCLAVVLSAGWGALFLIGKLMGCLGML